MPLLSNEGLQKFVMDHVIPRKRRSFVGLVGTCDKIFVGC